MVLWAIWNEEDYMVKVVLRCRTRKNHETEELVDLPLDILTEHGGWMWKALEDHLDRSFLKEPGSWTWRPQVIIEEIPYPLDEDWAACVGPNIPGQGPYLDWEYLLDVPDK